MDRFQSILASNLEKVRYRIRTEPIDVIHLPSFVLGCFLVISLSLIGPFLKMFIGNILLSLITVIKYAVLIGGIAACVVLGRKNGDRQLQNDEEIKNYVKKPKLPPRVPNEATHFRGAAKIEEVPPADKLAKNDFETIKHYNIPITKSRHRNYPIHSAYDSFINRAATNENGK